MTSTTPPPTMRAWVRRRRGPARSALELATSFPAPAAPSGASPDVLIRVSHVSLQYSTNMLLQTLPRVPCTRPTWIPDMELAGEVVAAGGGAGALAAGTRVVAFLMPPLPLILGRGVLAEYVRLPASQVVRIDAAVDPAAASGICCSGSTALGLVRMAGVREGHRVLVNGASGSIGSLLIQLCKLRGAKVVGVASGGNEDMVRGLGADEFVDYRSHDLPAYLAQTYSGAQFDSILDCVGTQPLFARSPAYLKPDGVYINVGVLEGVGATAYNGLRNTLLPTWLGGVPRRYIMHSFKPNYDDTVELVRLVEEGRLHIPVDSVFKMEDAIDAYERIATKRARGKVVVKVLSD